MKRGWLRLQSTRDPRRWKRRFFDLRVAQNKLTWYRDEHGEPGKANCNGKESESESESERARARVRSCFYLANLVRVAAWPRRLACSFIQLQLPPAPFPLPPVGTAQWMMWVGWDTWSTVSVRVVEPRAIHLSHVHRILSHMHLVLARPRP